MRVTDIGDRLRNERILSVIAHSLFTPTGDKLQELADAYESDPAVSAFACEDHGAILGAIILRKTGNQTFEILHIATAPPHRAKGVASCLIAHAAAALPCAALIAETDDGAVGFYRRYGFDIESLGEKYPGTTRYRCVWTSQ